MNTYKAILKGNRLQWSGDRPPESISLAVHVTVLEESADASGTGARAAAILEQLAAKGGVQSIIDPQAWQESQRGERPLPGRTS